MTPGKWGGDCRAPPFRAPLPWHIPSVVTPGDSPHPRTTRYSSRLSRLQLVPRVCCLRGDVLAPVPSCKHPLSSQCVTRLSELGTAPRPLSSQKPELHFPCCQATRAEHSVWHTIDVLRIGKKASLGFLRPAAAPCVVSVKKVGDPPTFHSCSYQGPSVLLQTPVPPQVANEDGEGNSENTPQDSFLLPHSSSFSPRKWGQKRRRRKKKEANSTKPSVREERPVGTPVTETVRTTLHPT